MISLIPVYTVMILISHYRRNYSLMIISRQDGKRAVMPLQPIFWNLGNGLVSLNQGVQNLLPLFSKDKPLLKA